MEAYKDMVTTEVKVMTYARNSEFSDLTQMRLICNQETRDNYCFVFAIISQDHNVYDE